jgi:carboxylesterase
MTELMKGAGPFFFPGDDVGCLLIHGFTGTPLEMRGLGEHLAKRGWTVHGVRLFGHSTRMEDMDRAHFEDWLASVEDGYHLLRPNCRRIIVMGFSTGADLAVVFAAQTPVDGLVMMAAPYALPHDPRLPFARVLSLVYPRIWKHRDNQRPTEHISYPAYPTRAVAELNDLLAEMRRSLLSVTAPALLIQSRHDDSLGVSADAMVQLHDGLGSQDKRTVWLEDSGHVITQDIERDHVFQLVTAFVKRLTDNGTRG